MSYQPNNGEAADMFRVMMWEMLQMHPQYRAVRRICRDLIRDLEAGNIKKKELPNRLQAVKDLFRSFDE